MAVSLKLISFIAIWRRHKKLCMAKEDKILRVTPVTYYKDLLQISQLMSQLEKELIKKMPSLSIWVIILLPPLTNPLVLMKIVFWMKVLQVSTKVKSLKIVSVPESPRRKYLTTAYNKIARKKQYLQGTPPLMDYVKKDCWKIVTLR